MTHFASVAFAQEQNAQSQNPSTQNPPEKFRDRPLTPEESERMYDDMGRPTGVRLYENLCSRARDFIAKKGAVDDPLLSQFRTMVGNAVVNALLNYCATGRFVLSFYDNDAKCPMKYPLSSIHTQLLTRLPFVRQGDAEIIALSCVETSDLIFLLNMRAHTVMINDSDLNNVTIGWGSISSRISIQDTTIRNSMFIEGMNVGSTLEIVRSRFGTKGGKSISFSVQSSSIGAISITDTQFNSDVYIGDNQIKGSARIGRDSTEPDAKRDIKAAGYFTFVRNDIKGDLRVSGAEIGRDLELQSNNVERSLIVGGNTAVKGSLELFGSRALTMELFGLEVEDQVRAVTARVTETLYVGQNSSGHGKVLFKKNLNLTNLKADRLRMLSVNVGEQITLISLTSNDLSLDEVSVGKKIHSGDARLRAVTIRRSTIPAFDCSDCEIAQYLLLAGTFSGNVNLRGAQIRASLLFRDGDGDGNGAAWTDGASLDLRNIQVETIEADLCDLRTTPEKGERCSGKMVPTQIEGAKFTSIVPSRSTKPSIKGKDGKGGGLLDQNPDVLVSWINASGGDLEFHPQPYDLVANALERAGRHRDSLEVRIAKLDHDYSSGNHSWFMRAVAKVARLLTGYGFQNERSVWAFAILIVAGMAVFIFGRQISPILMQKLRMAGFVNVLWYAFWFSIDRAVPPLHIDESMKEYSVLKPLSRAYFYLHRGAGTVIISFFVAGVTGLFK